ncbi:hypothetical protein BM221_003466 [Beauveria bassiana]|uniref:Uncharacterized protein n=1 Tax=Beauveria bassiana TaxID=176275 RepID=A0A2N6NUQ2_BEABA|nr:hypothetical protein BM221_003466 [Beauveria bassiana]
MASKAMWEVEPEMRSKKLCPLRAALALADDVRAERRLGRVKVAQKGVNLRAVVGRKVDAAALLLDKLGVGLDFLHEQHELRGELGVLVALRLGARLLKPALELNDDGKGELGKGNGSGPEIKELAEELDDLVADAVLVDARAQRRGERNVRIGGARRAQQRAHEVEAQREVERSGNEAHRAEGDLDERVDEQLELALLAASLGLLLGRAVVGEHAGPKVKRMRKLPVVDHAKCVILVVHDAVAEVDGELADEAKRGRVADGRIDALDRVVVGDAAALHEALVHRLENRLADALVADGDEPPQHQKRRDARRLGARGLRPKVNDGLGQRLDQLLEREQVRQDGRNSRQRQLERAVVGQRAEEVHNGRRVRLEQQRQRAELFAVSLHVHATRSRFLDGEVVVDDGGDLLQREDDNVVEHFGAVDGPFLLRVLVNVVFVEVSRAAKREHDLSCRTQRLALLHRLAPARHDGCEFGVLFGERIHGLLVHASVVSFSNVVLAVAGNGLRLHGVRVASILFVVRLGLVALSLARLSFVGLLDDILEATLEKVVDAHVVDLSVPGASRPRLAILAVEFSIRGLALF